MAETTLKPIFPDKAQFEESKQKYLDTNLQRNFDTLRQELPEESEETVRLVATGITRALHAAEAFVSAVPAHLLEGPQQLTIGWTTLENQKVGGISNALLSVSGRDKQNMKDVTLEELAGATVRDVFATVNLTSIVHDIKFVQSLREDELEYLKEIDDPDKRKFVAEMSDENLARRTEEVFQRTEIDMIHEFGHALDYIHANKNKRRLVEWKKHVEKNLGVDVNEKYGGVSEDKWQEYLDARTEEQARLWERYYKRKYYS